MLMIREETADDYSTIREINIQAFGGEAEATLVDQLRADGLVVVSLVGIKDGEISGHILFSELVVETGSEIIPAVALAPMAVLPGRQRIGIGSSLVREGLEMCGRRGQSLVAVLGHPEYYPRFGLSPELAKCLHGPHSGAAWMALELVPGVLKGREAWVRYPAAFDAVNH
jgi:putative acetyltransferase